MVLWRREKSMKKSYFLLFLSSVAVPLFGGTDLRAHVESLSYKDAWVDVAVSIADGHLRLDFQGPISHGSLIYDRETSQVTVVDDLHKTVLTLSQGDQTALKIMGAISSGRLKGGAAGFPLSVQKTYAIVQENAKAFFNGIPVLKGKGARIGGFTCDEYQTDFEGIKAREVWVTLPEKVGMSGEDYNTLRGMVHLAVDFCGDELTQLGADTSSFQQSLSNPQLPVRAVLYAQNKPSGRFKVRSVRTRTFDATTFIPPAGYRNLSLISLGKNWINGNP